MTWTQRIFVWFLGFVVLQLAIKNWWPDHTADLWPYVVYGVAAALMGISVLP